MIEWVFAKGADLVLDLPSPFDAAVEWPAEAGKNAMDGAARIWISFPVWGRRERSAVGEVNRPWMACLVPSQHGCCVGTALP